MKKKSVSNWTWRDYTLQLSVVIVGIMVTFIGSNIISNRSQQRQVKATMQLVVEELKTNRKELASICEKLRHDQNGMRMFKQYEMNSDKIPTDSLERYMSIIGSMRDLSPRHDALEVLKTSGVIPSVGDQQLLMDILGCYSWLDNFSINVDSYNQRKRESLNHLFANTPKLNVSIEAPRQAWKIMLKNPMCSSFIATSAYYFGDKDYFTESIARIGKVIEMVSLKYGFK